MVDRGQVMFFVETMVVMMNNGSSTPSGGLYSRYVTISWSLS